MEKPDAEHALPISLYQRYNYPRIFEFLENAEPGKGGEIQLTDALKKLASVEAIYAYDFVGKRYDVGNKLGFLEATVEFALKREDIRNEFAEYLKTKINGI